MRTHNPAFSEGVFDRLTATRSIEDQMTLNGAISKTGILFLLLVLTGVFSYTWSMEAGVSQMGPWLLGGVLLGFIIALATIFMPKWSPLTSPLYAILQGGVVGAISAIYASFYDGIIFQAILATLCVFLVMLGVYRSGLIKVTEKFRAGIVMATGGIALFYLISIVLMLFGVRVPLVFDGGPIAIGFSLVVIVIASLNFVLDFDFIEKASSGGSPKYLEWYAGFGLMITMVWLYLEMLRLLSYLRR